MLNFKLNREQLKKDFAKSASDAFKSTFDAVSENVDSESKIKIENAINEKSENFGQTFSGVIDNLCNSIESQIQDIINKLTETINE